MDGDSLRCLFVQIMKQSCKINVSSAGNKQCKRDGEEEESTSLTTIICADANHAVRCRSIGCLF